MDFSKELKEYVDRSNDTLYRFIFTKPFHPLAEAMHYGVLLGGKRLRPFLVYATGNMFGISDSTLDVPAAAVECIHAYSLIHDDLPAMDNDNTRRGQPTCHMRFGEAKAILAGNALQMLAFSILSDAPMEEITDHDRLAMVSELAMASGISGMCGGQALDLEAKSHQPNLKQIEYIHRHKTGALIRAAVRLGALSASKRGRDALPILDRYAESIGLAFQVQDDILDVLNNTTTLRKYQGIDQQIDKNTYLAVFDIEQARYKARNLIDNACQSLNLLSEQSLDTSSLKAIADYIIHRDK